MTKFWIEEFSRGNNTLHYTNLLLLMMKIESQTFAKSKPIDWMGWPCLSALQWFPLDW